MPNGGGYRAKSNDQRTAVSGHPTIEKRAFLLVGVESRTGAGKDNAVSDPRSSNRTCRFSRDGFFLHWWNTPLGRTVRWLLYV